MGGAGGGAPGGGAGGETPRRGETAIGTNEGGRRSINGKRNTRAPLPARADRLPKRVLNDPRPAQSPLCAAGGRIIRKPVRNQAIVAKPEAQQILFRLRLICTKRSPNS